MTTSPAVSIGPADLHELEASGETVFLIDVRPSIAWDEGHVPSAISVPLDRLDADRLSKFRPAEDGSPIYVICELGKRSIQACNRLQDAGISNVVNVSGGTRAWGELGLPLVKGRKHISLFRQVQITAGSLVAIASILGFLTHPLFFVLSALFGAGLVFAGVTNTCAMGMLLARMPWNRTRGIEMA